MPLFEMKQELKACDTVHRRFAIGDPPIHDGHYEWKFTDIKEGAKSGCVVCSMIERSCRHYDLIKPLTGWRRKDGSGQKHEELPFPPDSDDSSTDGYVLYEERHLVARMTIRPADAERQLESLVLLSLHDHAYDKSQTIELYRPMGEFPFAKHDSRKSKTLVSDEGESKREFLAIGFTPDVPRKSGTDEGLHRAKAWLDNCLMNHPNCSSSGNGNVPPLPKRVLDVSNGQVRLVEQSTRARYAALSYCWGPPAQRRLTTTRQNIETHKSDIEWQTLSKTHQDAVAVTRKMGLQYLWVSLTPTTFPSYITTDRILIVDRWSLHHSRQS
jgi:hypothetical protein